MKKNIIILISAIIILFVIALLMPIKKTNNKDNALIISILPLKYLIEKIVGDDYHIQVLVPSGSNPETYEPTPQQLISMSNAELVFIVGLIDFEQELMSKITVNKVVNLSDGIALLSGHCGCSRHHDMDQHIGIDPHIWTSPKHLKIISENAYKAITALPCPNKEKYKENYDKLIAELNELDATVCKILTDANVKRFFIYHPAMTYYSDSYDIEQISIEHDGKEPSAERLRNLIDIAKNKNVKNILYQREFSRSVVETIAGDIGATPVMIDPLAENIPESIIQITRYIAEMN